MVVASISWHYNIAKGGSFILGQFFVYVLMFMFRFEQLEENDYEAIEKAWIVSGLISIVLFLLVGNMEYRDGRNTLMIFGSRADPNEICGFFIVPVGIILYNLFNKKGRIKLREIIFAAVYVIMSIFVVFKTASRGGIIALAIAIVCTVLFSDSRHNKRRVWGVILVTVIFVVSAYYILPTLSNEAQSRLSVQALIDDDGGNRANIWGTALYRFNKDMAYRQLIGLGYYGYKTTAHNQLIQNLMDLGLVGLAIYLYFIFKAFIVCLRRARSYIPGFISMFILSLTLTMTAAYKPLWILLTVLALHLPDNYKSRRERKLETENE